MTAALTGFPSEPLGQQVKKAFDAAGEDPEEGDVGAGAGTICYGLKGGIGTSSRVIKVGEKEYTIGVLVQSNFGATEDLMVDGRPLDGKFWKSMEMKQRIGEKDGFF